MRYTYSRIKCRRSTCCRSGCIILWKVLTSPESGQYTLVNKFYYHFTINFELIVGSLDDKRPATHFCGRRPCVLFTAPVAEV